MDRPQMCAGSSPITASITPITSCRVYPFPLCQMALTQPLREKPRRRYGPAARSWFINIHPRCGNSFPRIFTISTKASRSEEHTSELQSLMRISYAVFCLKKKKQKQLTHQQDHMELTVY